MGRGGFSIRAAHCGVPPKILLQEGLVNPWGLCDTATGMQNRKMLAGQMLSRVDAGHVRVMMIYCSSRTRGLWSFLIRWWLQLEGRLFGALSAAPIGWATPPVP